MKRRCRIAVLMGGVSNERSVSLKSGNAIAEALAREGHLVVPVDVTERNIDMLDAIRPDVAFLALHGEFGEDGQIQTLLEEKGIPYTGSGPEASRLGMDKLRSKRAFVMDAVPTPDYVVIDKRKGLGGVASLSAHLGYPLVCKPPCGGSSIDVEIVRSESQLFSALCRITGHVVLIERYARGREFTMGILDGEPLPITEIVPNQEFFNYYAKYSDEGTQYIMPVALLESVYRKAQDVALRAYRALGCEHIGRADFLYGYDGRFYVLEVNTIPGFTPRSLLPMAAAYAGVDFGELCARITQMALRDRPAVRRPERRTA